MDKIIVKGMEFYGYHGAISAEQVLGQRFGVDVECYLSLKKAGLHDTLEDTVNYAEIYQLVKGIVEGDAIFKLIETLAERISDGILNRFSMVRAVKVRVIKPDPPIRGHYEHVAVEIYRSRENGE